MKASFFFFISAVALINIAHGADHPVDVPPQMPAAMEWEGPFRDTRVVKYVDNTDGVACYLFIPTNVQRTQACSVLGECRTQFPSGIGSISCVKVFDPRLTTPASEPPKKK